MHFPVTMPKLDVWTLHVTGSFDQAGLVWDCQMPQMPDIHQPPRHLDGWRTQVTHHDTALSKSLALLENRPWEGQLCGWTLEKPP